MKSIKKCKIATAYFIPLLIITGVIFTFFIVGEVITGKESTLHDRKFDIPIPTNYSDMTTTQRKNWLIEANGGEPTTRQIFEHPRGLISTTRTLRTYPNGFQITEEQYNSFLEGTIDDIDMWRFITKMTSFDIPLLNALGIIGIAVKTFLVFAIIVILYLLVPFTG